jgi:hypothetical protein
MRSEEKRRGEMKAVPANLIRARAYAIWEQNGRPSGLDKQHWEQAEREFLDAAALLAGAKTVPRREERRSEIDTRSDDEKGLTGERRTNVDRRSRKDT